MIRNDTVSKRTRYLQAFMMVCSLMTMSLASALGLDTLDAIAVPSVSRMILHNHNNQCPIRASSRIPNVDSPIINAFIRRQKHHIQSLQHRSLLDLSPKEQAHGIMKRGKGEREHGFVAVCEGTDDVEVEVGGRSGDDDVWW
jgi:hypothetical protein